MKYTWLIDSGHGGLINGKYQTAPNKMYDHGDGQVFYEGVFNRVIKQKLLFLAEGLGLHVIDVCPTNLDLDLDVRVDIVNRYCGEYSNAVLISLHSNAGGGTGFEIWTSVGQTRSDVFAELMGQHFIDSFEGAPFRADKSDGDLDKESQFYILKNTICPAILPECLFFDNYSNYQMLIDPEFQTQYASVLVEFMILAGERNL